MAEYEWYMRGTAEAVAVKDRTVYMFNASGELSATEISAHTVEHDCVRISAAHAAELKEREMKSIRERFAAHAATSA